VLLLLLLCTTRVAVLLPRWVSWLVATLAPCVFWCLNHVPDPAVVLLLLLLLCTTRAAALLPRWVS
jgi:hypothetical protein